MFFELYNTTDYLSHRLSPMSKICCTGKHEKKIYRRFMALRSSVNPKSNHNDLQLL